MFWHYDLSPTVMNDNSSAIVEAPQHLPFSRLQQDITIVVNCRMGGSSRGGMETDEYSKMDGYRAYQLHYSASTLR